MHLILETKGFDPLEEVKPAAAERWVAAVNADGTYGRWVYAIAKKTTEVSSPVSEAARSPVKSRTLASMMSLCLVGVDR